MKLKRHTLKTLFFTFFILTLLLFIFLPFLCNTYLLPRFLEKLPFSQKELSLSTISPWKIRGSLRLMQDGFPVAAIPRFEIQYSPTSLLKGEIDTVLLDAPSVHINYSDGKVSVAGQPAPATSAKNQTNTFALESPLSIHNIIIRNSRIALKTESGTKDVTLDSQIRLGFTSNKENKYKLTTLSVSAATEGDLSLTLSTQGVFSPKGMLFNTEFNIPNLTDALNFTPGKNDIALNGSLSGKGQIALAPNMEISHYQVNADINAFNSSIDGFSLRQTSLENPIQIQVEGDHSSFLYNLSGLSVNEPEQVDITAAGTMYLANKNITAKATVYSARVNHPFTVDLNGRIDSADTLVDLHVSADTFSLNKDTTIGPLALNGNFTYIDTRLNAQITGKIATIKEASRGLTLQNINWDIPLQFPLTDSHSLKDGQLNIESVRYKNRDTARLSANLEQIHDGFKYTTDLISKMDIKGQIHCDGSVFLNGNTEGSCTLADTKIDSALFPDYIKIPEGTTFTGLLAADATFALHNADQQASLNLYLSKGALTSGKTTINGVETIITFPNLPSFQSGPGQLATIGSIESGKIQLQNGKIFYRIENEQHVFLEKASLNWCGGKIEMGSLNLSSDMKGLEATLYCDRLGFTELLKQFGIEGAQGQGSLNGRLPIEISNKGVHFDDGFLFSTPGNSGIVRFNNTDQLRQGMPDIGQSATLDYSIKALENFAYNWTKLSFNTEGDELLLTMQLDGEPSAPLPFGYKNGQIVATEQGPGLQHPVRLDMNFRLPLQDLFQYGKSLQSLMEKM